MSAASEGRPCLPRLEAPTKTNSKGKPGSSFKRDTLAAQAAPSGMTLQGRESVLTAPPAPTASRISMANGCSNAKDLALALSADKSDFAIFPGDYVALLSACEFAFGMADKAYALRTTEKDVACWRSWKEYCRSVGTSPWRTDPEASLQGSQAAYLREVVLLTNALSYFMRTKKPRARCDLMIKPQTAMATLRGVERIHKRNHVHLIPLSALSLPLKGLMRDYVKRFGPKSLIPKRREAFTNPMIATLLTLPEGTALGSASLRWGSLEGLSLAAAIEVASETGFRKVELFQSNEESDYLTWEHVGLQHEGRWYEAAAAPIEVWRALGIKSYVAFQPPLSKADQHGMVWSALLCYRKFKPRGRSAARRVAELAIARLEAGLPLKKAVFVTEDGKPLTTNRMKSTLYHMLKVFLPEKMARLFTWHSFRSYLATAMLAAGATNPEIQAVLRWQTEESLQAYARMGADTQTDLIAQAQLAVVTAVQSRNLPIYEAFDMFVAMQEVVGG